MTDNILDDLEDRAAAKVHPEAMLWADPLPLPSEQLPVERFEIELLPGRIRPWIVDIAERLQCPIEYVAVAAMVALGSVIGRNAAIRPKRRDDWKVFPNCWGAAVGRPATMKSPAISEALKPLERLIFAAQKEYEAKKADHGIRAKVAEVSAKHRDGEIEKAVKGGKSDEAIRIATLQAAEAIEPAPVLRRYKVVDASVESLGEICIENPVGVLAYRDELVGLLKSLDKEGQEGSRGFYLQGYDANQGYTFDRIGRGRNLHIPAVCISMFGGIQPARLGEYIRHAVEGGSGDDGLLQRFGMMVCPDISQDYRKVDRYPDTAAKNAAFEVFERLAALPGRIDEDGQLEPEVFKFAGDAQDIFDDWLYDLIPRLRKGELHPAIESHLMKYTKMVPALALICALADDEIEVSVESVNRALMWSEFLESHAMRIYNMGLRPTVTGAKALLRKIRDGAISTGFKAADVYLKGWSNLSSSGDVHDALALLVDLNYLYRVEQPSGDRGGRPSKTYLINPKFLRGAE